MTGLAEDIRSEAFRTLSQARRIAITRDYFATRERVFGAGEFALQLIRVYADTGKAAAEGYAKRRLNTPGAGPSDPAAGSE